jgi:c-di-GMP-binding flagellar brake protein YcgR
MLFRPEEHPFNEKRRYRRKELMTSAVMQVRTPSGEKISNYGVIKDISLGGVCFTLYDFDEQSLSNQEEFTFMFRLPHRKEFTTSTCTLKRVKRLVYTVQVAATFSEVDPKDRCTFEQFCA